MDKPDWDFIGDDEEQLNNLKKWLFQENMRLSKLEKDIEDERKLIDIQKNLLEKQQRKNMLLKSQLEGQKALFDSQWAILESEIRQLAVDKDVFKREKARFRDETIREVRRSVVVSANAQIFFKGVNDSESLKKRYRDLMKIFHPDNQNGDNSTLLAIQVEYDRLKQQF